MSCLADGLSLPAATLAYLLFVALTIVGPALACLRLLRLPIEPAVVVPLGLAFCAGGYWLALLLGLPWLFPLLALAFDLSLLWRRRERWELAEGPGLRGLLPPALALVALFALTQYPGNRCLPDGSFALDPLERVDTAFHVGVTWELVNGYPPQVPGLSGVPLRYHFGPHLVRAAAARFAGVHPYDAFTRFDLTLWALALALSLRTAAWTLQASPAAVTLAPWTLLLGGFAFLFGGTRISFQTELLGDGLLLSLFFGNSLIPALALALGVPIVLRHALRSGAPAWLAVGCILGMALPTFKIFLAAQLLLGLGAAFLLTKARREMLLLAWPCLCVTAALSLGHAPATAERLLQPFGPAQSLRAALGLEPAQGASLLAWGALWTLAALGLRVCGLGAAVSALRASPWASILATLALSGWPARWLLRLNVDGNADEATYFTLASGVVLWLFAVGTLVEWARRSGRPLLVGVLAAALSLPVTAQFVAGRLSTPFERIPPGVPAAMSALARLTAPGEPVLQTTYSRWPPPPMVFIGRRLAFTEYIVYLNQFAPAELRAEREHQVRRFFKTREAAEARGIARALGVRYVVVFGRTPRSEAAGLLEPVLQTDDASLYRLAER